MGKKEPLVSASGYPGSVMTEARAAGLSVPIVNNGHLAEPGTACMLASVESRSMREAVGARADRMPVNLDNTGIYHFQRAVLLEN